MDVVKKFYDTKGNPIEFYDTKGNPIEYYVVEGKRVFRQLAINTLYDLSNDVEILKQALISQPLKM